MGHSILRLSQIPGKWVNPYALMTPSPNMPTVHDPTFDRGYGFLWFWGNPMSCTGESSSSRWTIAIYRGKKTHSQTPPKSCFAVGYIPLYLPMISHEMPMNIPEFRNLPCSTNPIHIFPISQLYQLYQLWNPKMFYALWPCAKSPCFPIVFRSVVTEGHQPEDAQGHHHPQIWWQTGDLRNWKTGGKIPDQESQKVAIQPRNIWKYHEICGDITSLISWYV